MRKIVLAENLEALARLPAGCAQLAYLDPPFNTGCTRSLERISVRADAAGERKGYGEKRYRVERGERSSFEDSFEDYLGFLMPRIEATLRCLDPRGSLFVHLDARELHYVKVELDRLLGRERFMNEIVWAYDFGGRPKDRWPSKHDSILWYALSPGEHVFHHAAIDRIPYLAPRLVGPEKAARGKTPTDVWWHTIVPTSGRERTGYPTQKPLGILERIVRVHSDRGAVVLDPFAGSGTSGEAAARNGRGFVLVDQNPRAAALMAKRLADFEPELVGFSEEPLREGGGAGPGTGPPPLPRQGAAGRRTEARRPRARKRGD